MQGWHGRFFLVMHKGKRDGAKRVGLSTKKVQGREVVCLDASGWSPLHECMH